jgi:hypothetical protein
MDIVISKENCGLKLRLEMVITLLIEVKEQWAIK